MSGPRPQNSGQAPPRRRMRFRRVRLGIGLAAVEAFTAAGAKVIGVSPDSLDSHCKFKAKHKLSVALAADEEKAAAEAFGVWVEKSMYGRKYMGVERTTVLVGRDGRVARVWRKVKVPGHAAEVLEAVKSL